MENEPKIVKEGVLKNKLDFQLHLMAEMGVKRGDSESEGKWVDNYAKLVSDIIDKHIPCDNCSIIRSSVANRDFETAAEKIKPELEKLEKVEIPA